MALVVTASAFALHTTAGYGGDTSALARARPATNSTPPHVMLIVEENRDRNEVIGAADMPYLNSLANKYTNTTSWEGVGPSSLSDYLALISGSTQGVTANPLEATFPGATLGSQLSEVGIPWKAYIEDLPAVASLVGESGNYVRRHNPFPYFPGTNGPNVVPGSQFASDVAEGKLPPFVWYTPNVINDGESGKNEVVDSSLKSIVAPVLASAWYKEGGVIIITWDESNAAPDVIPTVVVSGEGSGTSFTSPGNHYGTLATIENLYGLPLLGAAAHATPLPTPGVTAKEVILPAVVTKAASQVTQTSSGLNATVNANGLAVKECKFEYGTTGAYDKTAPCSTSPGSGSSPVEVSASVTGLTANTTYHFRIVATDSNGESQGSDETFKTVPEPPAVVTEAASSVAQTVASLNATVNPNGAEVNECKFEYGTTSAYGSTAPCSSSPGSGTSVAAVSASVTGLTASTTYHFRIVAANSSGESKGSDETLKTLPEGVSPPPTVETKAASSVTQNGVSMSATVNPNGTEVKECKFEYGTSGAYGKTASCLPSPGFGNSAVEVSASVTGLAANTTYHFRISATNESGTSKGSIDEIFKTLPNAPAVETKAASSVTQTSATLNASVFAHDGTVEGCQFEYGPTTSYGFVVPCSAPGGPLNSPVEVSASVNSLGPGSLYYFRIVATNPGGTSYGVGKALTTLPMALPQQASAGQGVLASLEQHLGPPVPDAELASTFLTVDSSGAVSIKVTCPAEDSSCAGTVTLRALAVVRSRVAGHKSKLQKATSVAVAVGLFKIAGGQTRTVRLHLSAMARVLLSRAHVLRVRAAIVAHDHMGATHIGHTTVTLRASKATRGRAKG